MVGKQLTHVPFFLTWSLGTILVRMGTGKARVSVVAWNLIHPDSSSEITRTVCFLRARWGHLLADKKKYPSKLSRQQWRSGVISNGSHDVSLTSVPPHGPFQPMLLSVKDSLSTLYLKERLAVFPELGAQGMAETISPLAKWTSGLST